MTAQSLRIDGRNHVEKPLLDQLAGLDWEIVDLDNKQRPADSFRESFAEVVMLPVLRERFFDARLRWVGITHVTSP